MNTYKSTPRNKLIADFCKDLGWIEKYGSGVRRILEEFKAYGLKSPIFQNISDGFMVTVFAGSSEKGSEKGSEKSSEKSSEKIVKELQSNSSVTISELAIAVGISTRSIEKHLEKLKAQGIIERIGSAKGGYWKVLK